MVKYYAVRIGRKSGIYRSWDECKRQVDGFPNAKFKSFLTEGEAKEFMNAWDTKDMHNLAPRVGITDRKVQTQDISSIKDNEVVAYVDGSYRDSDKTYSYGYLLINNKNKKYSHSQRMNFPEFVSMRNVAGEVIGSMQVIRKAIELGYIRIYLHYDYQGIENWCTGKWTANNKLTEGYRDFYNEAKDKIEVKFIKVPAHSGVEYNEVVDKLAKGAKLQ